MTYNDPARSETHQPVTWPRRNTAMREMLAKSEPKPKGAVRFLVKAPRLLAKTFTGRQSGGFVLIGLLKRRPPPPSSIQTALQNASSQYGVPVSLLQAVAFQESSYNPNAVTAVGAARAHATNHRHA